jgi:hypothetical protein
VVAVSNEINIKITATTSTAGPIAETEKQTKKLGDSLKDVGKIAAGVLTAELFTGAATRVKEFVTSSVDAANDLGESVNAVGKIFGQQADKVEDWGRKNSESIGLSLRAFNQAATPLGAALKNAGLDMDQVSDQTIKLTQRAADMASVFNTDVGDALTDIQAALRGESDPIEKYGVGLSAAAVEQRALADSGKRSATELSRQELTLARLNILYDQTKDSAGDFKDTVDGYANSQRVANAQIEDAKAKLGSGLLPVLAKTAQLTGDVAQAFGDMPPALQGVVGVVTAASAGLLLLAPRIIATKTALAELGITAQATKSFLGGPWGLAIGGAITLITAFAVGQKEASDAAKELSGQLNFQTGAFDDNNRKVIAARLEQEGLLKTARELGVSSKDLVSAILGNKDAYDRLGISTINVNKNTDEATAKRKTFNDAVLKEIGIVGEANESKSRETGATKTSTSATRDNTRAREDNIAALKEQADKLKAQVDPLFNLIDKEKQVREKQKEYNQAVKEHGAASAAARRANLDLAQAILDASGAAADASGKFNGHLDPALKAILKAGGLTATQILNIETAFKKAKKAGEAYEGTYSATAKLTIQVHGLTSIHFDSEGNPTGHAFGGVVGAASGGSRGGVTMVNDGAGVRRGEMVRLPYGASVIPAGQSQGMMEALVSAQRLGVGGLGGTLVAEAVLPRATGLAWMDSLVEGLRFVIKNKGQNNPQEYLKG